MNPLVWRFMGGATVATAVDLVIPGYSRILWAGLGAALPEGGKKAGIRVGMQKGFEMIGKAEWKVLMSPVNLGRFGFRTIPKVGFRVIPFIGWAMLAHDVAGLHPQGAMHFYSQSVQETVESQALVAGGRSPIYSS